MRKLLRSFKRDLSLLLVIALLFGCLPSNTLAASAQEAEQTKVQEEIEEEAVVQENELQSEQQVEDEELLEEEETQVEQQTENEDLLEEEKTEVEQQTENKELLQEEESETNQQTGNEGQQKENQEIVQEKEPEIEVLEEEGLSYLVTKPAEGPEFTFSGDETVTKGAEYTFTVVEAEGYTVTVIVKINDEQIEGVVKGEAGAYTVPAEKITGNLTIEVTPEEIPQEAVKYTVTAPTGEGFIFVGEETAIENEPYTFTLEAVEGYEITKVEVRVGEQPTEEIKAAEDGKTYTISAEKIIDSFAIMVTGDNLTDNADPKELEENTAIPVNITVDRSEIILLNALVNGLHLSPSCWEPTEDGKGTVYTYEVPYGTEMTIVTELSSENYEFTSATTTVGTEIAKNETIEATGFTYTIKVTDQVESLIKTQGFYRVELSEDGNVSLSPNKNTYSVDANKSYQVEVYQGNERLELKSFSITKGKTVGKVDPELPEGNEYAIFKVNPDDSEKTLEMNISVEGKQFTYKLTVNPVIKEIKINGKVNSSVSLPVRSEVEYALVKIPAKANIDLQELDIMCETEAEEVPVAAEITEEGKLRVCVTTSKAGEKVKLTLNYPGIEKVLASLTITTKAPDWVAKQPTVKVVESDAYGFSLSLNMPGVTPYEEGEYYYKLTAYDQDDVSGNKIMNQIVRYIPYEEAANPIRVEAVNKQYNTYGSSYQRKYNVSVELLQIEKGANIEEEGSENNNIVLFKSKAAALKNVIVKAFYFEDKLTIKKGTTTLYVGQKNVKIGTASYGKNTTVKGISAMLSSYIDSRDSIEITCDEEGNIFASVSERAVPGNYYTVKVTPATQENTYAKPVEIKLTVVQNIYDIEIKAPSAIYKPAGKAATFKAQVVYNNGDSLKQPKTKKVIWSICDAEGKPVDSKLLSVKNGQVTVAKNYIVSGNDTYYLFAKAADYQDNPLMRGVLFTITNQPMEMGEAVIVGNEGTDYRVVARSGSTVEAQEIYGTQLAVLKKGVEKKEIYSKEEILSVESKMLTYTTSNKNAISIDEDGMLLPGKLGKNIKLTVTANDGSNTKAVLEKLTIGYRNTKEIGLTVQEYNTTNGSWGDYIINRNQENETVQVSKAKDYACVVSVVEMNGNGATYANHKLEVKGGKILYKYPESGIYYVCATAAKMSLILTDMSVKPNIKKVYTLENTFYQTGGIPTVSTKDKPVEFQEKISVTYNVKFPKGITYDSVYVAVDQVKLFNDYKYQFLDRAGKYTGEESLEKPLKIEDNKITLTFNAPRPEDQEQPWYPVLNGSYKLNFVFGNIGENGDFIAASKPLSVTLKIGKQSSSIPKLSPAKLTANYTLKIKETNEFMLTLSNKNHEIVRVGTLLSANVKGQSNYFANKFAIYYDKNDGNSWYQSVPGKVTLTTNFSYIPKDKFNGYVSYVECKDQYGRTYYLQNVPISVTMKDSKAPVITAETVTLKTNDFEAKELVFKKGEKEIDIFDIVSLDSRFEVVQLHEGMPPTIKPVDPYSIEPGTYEVTVWVTDMDTGVGYLYHHNKDRSNLDTIGTKVTIKVTVVEESE